MPPISASIDKWHDGHLQKADECVGQNFQGRSEFAKEQAGHDAQPEPDQNLLRHTHSFAPMPSRELRSNSAIIVLVSTMVVTHVFSRRALAEFPLLELPAFSSGSGQGHDKPQVCIVFTDRWTGTRANVRARCNGTAFLHIHGQAALTRLGASATTAAA